jgi:hypothetical protein
MGRRIAPVEDPWRMPKCAIPLPRVQKITDATSPARTDRDKHHYAFWAAAVARGSPRGALADQ